MLVTTKEQNAKGFTRQSVMIYLFSSLGILTIHSLRRKSCSKKNCGQDPGQDLGAKTVQGRNCGIGNKTLYRRTNWS